ncbi:hypothetical protein MMC16_000382 [Acarospora aff. strigata]|nr:hypothetical protein [Acarospora aff. strigata]
MPASITQNTVAQIMSAASEDKREQPWKKILADASVTPTSDDVAEPIKAGGPCDVLTSFFAS